MTFHLHSSKPIDEFLEAKKLGIHTRPVLLGPVSFVLQGKFTTGNASRAEALESIVPIYREVLTQLHKAGADWVQMDEPCLALDLDPSAQGFYREAYDELLKAGAIPQCLLATYFGCARTQPRYCGSSSGAGATHRHRTVAGAAWVRMRGSS